MDNRFFEQPILNSPYEYPSRYWELDKRGQPRRLGRPAQRHFPAFRQTETRENRGKGDLSSEG